MKNIFRGGAILLLISMFVVLIYAQTRTGPAPARANESLGEIVNNNKDNNLSNNSQVNNKKQPVNSPEVNHTDLDSDKKLVKKTASVRATNSGASRGKFSASAYCLSGKTATGQRVRRGIIAADPRVLPLGSTVVIDAGPWSGTYLVADTGGAIKGKKIDIWVPGCAEARKFGRRSVQIFSPQ